MDYKVIDRDQYYRKGVFRLLDQEMRELCLRQRQDAAGVNGTQKA